MQIIDGRKIKNEILENVSREVAALSFVPVFCDVLVGEDLASVQYVNMKKKNAESVGMKFYEARFPSTISQEALIEEIQKINNLANICGVIVQLPLPKHISRQRVLDAIDPALDVDCLGKVANERFYAQNYSGRTAVILGLPTALACKAVLDATNIELNNKKIVVLGQGELVGKPITHLLKAEGYDVAAVDSQTPNQGELLRNADVVITGIGQGNYLTGAMLKPGVVVIDAGTSEENSAVVGDVDFESVKEVASYISPVPGGVGPVTVAMLLQNVLKVAKNKNQH